MSALGARAGVLEAGVVVVLFAAAIVCGGLAWRGYVAHGGVPRFYQEWFGPAVLLACGKGVGNPDDTRIPALADFLRLKSDRFECRALPEPLPLKPLSGFQRRTPYMQGSVALVWRLFSVSWSAVALLSVLLFAVTTTTVYGLCRLVAGRVLAVVCALGVMVSTLQLVSLPHLRDYAKAPFLLATMLALGWLVRRPMPTRRLLGVALATGGVVGLGLGFRADLFVAIPPFAAATLFLVPGARWRARVGAGLAFGLGFLLVGGPVLAGYTKGSNNGHVILLGLMTPFDDPLRITPPIYDLGHHYLDLFAAAIVNGYAAAHGPTAPVVWDSPEYERASLGYLGEIARTVPADVLVRGYAAIAAVLQLPFEPPFSRPPPWIKTGTGKTFYEARTRLLAPLAGVAPAAVLCALAGLAAFRLRWALAALLIVTWFPATASLQFDPRHAFYLEVLSWWAFAAVLQGCLSAARRLCDLPEGAASLPLWRAMSRLGVAAAFGAAVVGAAVGALGLARAVQGGRVRALLTRYSSAARDPIPVAVRGVGGGRVLLTPAEAATAATDVESRLPDYFVAEFSGDCPYAAFGVTLRYGPSGPAFDFSRTLRLTVPEGSAPTVLIFPTYSFWSSYQGLELPERTLGCLRSLSRLRGADFPIQLTVRLTPDWRSTTLYQRLEAERRGEGGERDYVAPADFAVLRTRYVKIELDRPVYRASIVRVDGEGTMEVSGAPDLPFAYLLVTAERRPGAGGHVVAEGELETGGLTVGLLKQGRWSRLVNITDPGRFRAAIEPDGTGPFQLVVASYLTNGFGRVSFLIRRIGWAVPGPDTR